MDRSPRAAFFRRAHALCRKTLQPGDSYRVTFGACLRHLYAQQKTERLRHAFLQEHTELMHRMVRKTSRVYKFGWQDEEDLRQDLQLRLLTVDPYDPARSATPATWLWWQVRAVAQTLLRRLAADQRTAAQFRDARRCEQVAYMAEKAHRVTEHAVRRVDLQRTLDQMPPALLACVASKATGQGDQESREALGLGRRARDTRIRRWRQQAAA